MFNNKKEATHKKDAPRRKVSVPFPEPATERELLHNRRFVRENLSSFSKPSWYIGSALPLVFTAAGSMAAIHNLSAHSNPIGALGAWAGAEGVVAVFSYLAMTSLFRGTKVPGKYTAGILFATLAAVLVNVLVTTDRQSAMFLIAGLAPIATAASVSAVFTIIRGCLDDAAQLEFFTLHQKESADLLRTKQLSRVVLEAADEKDVTKKAEKETAEDEALGIVLRHTSQSQVAGLIKGQVEGLVGSLGSTVPALEAPKPVQMEAEEAEVSDVEEVEAELVQPLRIISDRQPITRNEERHAVLPESVGSVKPLTVKLPEEPSTELVPVQKAPTRVQVAKRQLAKIYWTAKVADRNLADADFRRRFMSDFAQYLTPEQLSLLDRNEELSREGGIHSSYLSKLKNPVHRGFAAPDFLGEIKNIEVVFTQAEREALENLATG